MKLLNLEQLRSAHSPAATHAEEAMFDASTVESTDGRMREQAPDPGPFPVDALSASMRAIAEELAIVHSVPVELPGMCALGTVSGSLGLAFMLEGAVLGKGGCFGGLYIIPGAAKSSGKGSVANYLVRPLIEASSALEAAFREAQLPRLKSEKSLLEKRLSYLENQYAKGRNGSNAGSSLLNQAERHALQLEHEEAKERVEELERLIKAQPTYWVENTTSEKLGELMHSNRSGLLIYSPEGAETLRVVLGKYRKDGHADCDLFLKSYSVEPCRVDRISRGVCQIERPWLSVLLLVQPSIIMELFSNEEAFDRGLTARCLPFIVETEPTYDDGCNRVVSEAANSQWHELIRAILGHRKEIGDGHHKIACSPEAREVFRQFHNESVALRLGEFRSIEAELGRWRENAIRIGLAIAVADDPGTSTLTQEQAERAVRIMRWCGYSTLKVLDTARRQKLEARACDLEELLSKRGGAETLRNLSKNNGYASDEVHDLARRFPTRLAVRSSRESPQGGRPSEVVCLVRVTSP